MELQATITPRCIRCGYELQDVSGGYGYCYNENFQGQTGVHCPLYGKRQRILSSSAQTIQTPDNTIQG